MTSDLFIVDTFCDNFLMVELEIAAVQILTLDCTVFECRKHKL